MKKFKIILTVLATFILTITLCVIAGCSKQSNLKTESKPDVELSTKTVYSTPSEPDINYDTYVDEELNEINTKAIQAPDGIEVKSNQNFTGRQNRLAYYKNCKFTEAIFINSSATSIKELWFENCTLSQADFTSISNITTIYFVGYNIVSETIFDASQTANVENSTKFLNCENLKLQLNVDNTYDFDLSGSDVSFVGSNPSNVSIKMTGGSLLLPYSQNALQWDVNLTNVDVTTQNSLYPGINAVGCRIQSDTYFTYFRSITSSVVYYDTTQTSIRCEGLKFSDNEVRIGTKETEKHNVTSFVFNASICIGNYINGASISSGKYVLIEMSAGSYGDSVFGNYNGMTVFKEN